MLKPFLLLIFLLSAILSAPIPATVYLKNGTFTVVPQLLDPTGVAFGLYDPSLFEKGWDTLSLTTNSHSDSYSDYEKAYGLGFLEGVLTQQRIYDHFLNIYRLNYYYEKDGKMPEYVADFFTKQRTWIRESFLQNQDDPYWQNVYAILLQLEGLIDGYNSVVSEERQISYTDFQVIASDSDISDVLMIDPGHRPNYEKLGASEVEQHMDARLHCSSIVKVTDDFSDVFFGHTTWGNYAEMARIFKEYNTNFNFIPIKAKTVSFSSYPGTLGSIDDFYVTSAKLGVMETTNPVFNNDLYNLIVPETLCYWHRVQLSNRMSDNGQDWTILFSKHNSGTYNNQNMVVDLKKVDPINKYVHDGTLWVSEQIPGQISSADVTHILRYGYWPSYNTPYFPEIRNVSGVDRYLSLHPETRPSYDYETCVRANIFRRDQGKIQDFDSFKELFRYNDYQNDPLSLGNVKWSIASRNDLNTSMFNCTGATDAKVASLSKVVNGEGVSISIISGPTNEIQPTFEWNKAHCARDPRYQWVGMPEKFDFKWEEFRPIFDKGNREATIVE